MKKYCFLFLIAITTTTFHAQKKFKEGEFGKLIEQSNKEFACSLADASWASPELKTDSNLNDYFNFRFCNSYKTKIIGVVFGEKQGYGYIEVGRYKMSLMPFKTGNAKLYINNNISKYNKNNYKIIKVIFFDGSSLDVNH